MPTHAANTFVSGDGFQLGAFSSGFERGDVRLQGPDTEFAVLARSVLDMWNDLFASDGW